MTVNAGEPQYKAFNRGKDEEERLLDRFRDPNDPLKLLVVTSNGCSLFMAIAVMS